MTKNFLDIGQGGINQIEFNKKYPKEVKEIKLEYEDFEEQLIIENYSELKKLYLQNVEDIEKIVLKDLIELEECTIWDCGMKELVIENCPQIKKLNVRKNLLTNLEFLKDLNNLENLEIDGNTKIISGLEYLPGSWEKFSHEITKLTEVLRLYGNDWKTCKKDSQEIFGLSTKQDFQGLIKKFWDLKKSREDLKKEISPFANYSTTSKLINTKELVLNLKKEFKDKETRINLLEFRVWELTELSKKQGEKIRSYLVNFGSEEETLRKLIKVYLEFVKVERQEIDSSDYYEKCEEYEKRYKEIKKDLQSKLPQESRNKTMNEVQRILANCRELFEQDLEVKTSLDDKSKLIEEQKKDPEITDNSEKNIKLKEREATHQNQVQQRKRSNSVLLEIELAYNKGKVEVLERSLTPIPENKNETLISQLIVQLKEKLELTQEEVNKLNNYLKAKKDFLVTRQKTIEELKELSNKLEKKFTKQEIIGEIGNTTSNIGGAITNVITFGIPKVVGEVIKSGSVFKKIKLSKKGGEQFQVSLENEESELTQLNNSLNILSLKDQSTEEEPKLFNLNYKTFDVLIKDGIWQGKSLNLEKMEKAIITLSENLDGLKAELVQEEKQFKEFSDWFNKSGTYSTTREKRQLSITSQVNVIQGETKFLKTIEEQKEYQTEPMEINHTSNWTDIHFNFTKELINQWQNLGFAYRQTQDWVNAGLKPTDANFAAWFRDVKKVDTAWVLNHGNDQTLNQEFFQWWQENQLQSHQEILSKK